MTVSAPLLLWSSRVLSHGPKFFHFTDLDLDEFTGSLRVEGEAILSMSYGPESQERLRQKPEKQDHLADNTQGYQKTNERYPTIYAHKLNWEAASLLIQQGESLAYVKEQLDHHSIRVTEDTYGHLVPGGNRAAADRLDDPEEECASSSNPDATTIKNIVSKKS